MPGVDPVLAQRRAAVVPETKEVVLKARRLIGSAGYGPGVLSVLFEAFDSAWEAIAPTCGSDPQVIEATRTRLASTILALAQDRPKPDPDELRDSALRILGLSSQG
jgi:hypothetical protein